MGSLRELINATPWVDTHEHLVEERDRLTEGTFTFAEADRRVTTIPADWTALITDYALDDLTSAGLAADAGRDLVSEDLTPVEKWDLVEPCFEAVRTTGYLRAVDLTTERLFGLRLSRTTCDEIDRLSRELRQPGYYANVLRDVANVQRAQVHSLIDDPFRETSMPDLLEQDISLVPLVFGRHARLETLSGVEVGTLDDYLSVVDWCFETYGRRAVAAKCLVKIHTGYLAGNREIGMRWLAEQLPGITSVVECRPGTTFVLMHAGWPYGEHLIALAKHYPNVVVDLCWAWILAPLATAEFVERFLTTAPANKLLCFGGDYLTVETVVGHAEIARRGLEAALRGLIDAAWVSEQEALDLVPQLMHGNADCVFLIRATRPLEASCG